MANVLIVDDDEMTLKMVAAALAKSAHTVFVAKDGHSALEIAEKETLHLVVTDINMPKGINGFALIKMLREKPKSKDLPMLIISARRSESDVVRGIESGVDDYVIKPIDFDIFSAKVNSLLKKGGHAFALSRVNYSGTAQLPIQLKVVAISEEGLQVISTFKLEENSKVQLESPIYDEVGIAAPMTRVAHCERLETDDNSYSIKLNFIGLNSGDLQKVRLFATKANLKDRD